MKTIKTAPQSSPAAAMSPVLVAACAQLARINPTAFACRPRAEALAAVRAAIAARPGSSSPAECQALARKAGTARNLADKLDAAPQYYPDLFAAQLQAHGIASRAAIVELLRGYHRQAYERTRADALKAENARARAGRAQLRAAGAFA